MDWNSLALSLSVGLAGLGTIFFTGIKGVVAAWFENWRSKIARERYSVGLKKMSEFHSILEELKPMSNVDRVLLFCGRNGGGLPQPGKPYTVNCFYGWSVDSKKHPEQTYSFGIQVDTRYREMMCEVLEKGKSVQTTATMPADATLRDYYLSEGVKQAVIFCLNLDRENNELIFISVASYQREFTPNEYSMIALSIARMRALMDRNVP